EPALTRREGALEVQAADDTVVGRADGQVDERDRTAGELGIVSERPAGDRFAWRPAERVALVDVDCGQKRGQGADGRALGGALGPANEDSAQARVDGRQDQGPLHER